MTLLEIVKEFCRRTGLTVPSIVATSQDDGSLQLMGLLNEVLDDLVPRSTWTALERSVVFPSVAGEDQGALETLAPYGFRWVTNDTIFDRTRRLPVFGPRGPEYWQAVKALPFSGPYYQYRIQQGRLLILPDMPAGHTMAFEYQSNWAVRDPTLVDPAPGAYKIWFTKDTDICLMPDPLILAGLRWAWKKEKGMRFDADFSKYENMVAEYQGHDGTKPNLNMNGPCDTIQPGIWIPSGNWPL